ncbi:UDP-4-amino-4,6-dideoxy-N-acetyl-beta-L-altrosamine N-acetyltransferase [Arcobacter lacus]|uniref:UDP-4-amino-4, 6-dideoxy-N-acetyl-beta-L-altrosamine N-acetyltransferase n=1 Tax=Arcobacter lacus TaxID=1912876 RepID=UPI0021BAD3ED|nr:UDP-4-amino-4,6-dideoxy-N-acetyl-beta-L-altrosamine N-acetyltransferase [Arcobacter lacus]MCT7912439.1 UDP-4-amino-4,6-dideoxy-N-acetyl-beta-L-altrosamine N-acetyltransferase [Arcobacter lacus]
MKNIKLFNFTTLSLEEKKMILEWRNNPNVRKWMYTQDNINLENHLKFIEELKIKDDQLYFLVKKNENYIGVIDFIDINPNISLKMGIYTNPTLKGNGKILLETIINFSFEILKVEKIFSEVFFENEKAYNLYKNYNFKEVENKVINNKIVICMEKKNENRKF